MPSGGSSRGFGGGGFGDRERDRGSGGFGDRYTERRSGFTDDEPGRADDADRCDTRMRLDPFVPFQCAFYEEGWRFGG